jgi:hypothetical protein
VAQSMVRPEGIFSGGDALCSKGRALQAKAGA